MLQPINYNLRSSGSSASQLTETKDQHRMASRDDRVQPKVNALLATSMLKLSMYGGTMKQREWASQFKRWLKLQK